MNHYHSPTPTVLFIFSSRYHLESLYHKIVVINKKIFIAKNNVLLKYTTNYNIIWWYWIISSKFTKKKSTSYRFIKHYYLLLLLSIIIIIYYYHHHHHHHHHYYYYYYQLQPLSGPCSTVRVDRLLATDEACHVFSCQPRQSPHVFLQKKLRTSLLEHWRYLLR
jgi:hypothetical protein